MARLRGARRQAGLALVFTLWGLTMLGLMAAAFLSGMRTEMRVIANIASAAEAGAIADGAIHWAILGLMAPPDARAFRTDGTSVLRHVPGGAVRLAVQDEAGKVDLNGADAPRLARLIAALGEPPETATRIADALVDFRDRDGLAQGGGAEDAAYPPGQAGPANRPFRAIDELREVTGIGRALAARLAPHVTVGPFARRVDARVATRAALLAQPGIDPAEADRYLAARSLDPAAQPPRGATYAASPGTRFTIRAVARASGGAVHAREALVTLDPAARLGFRIEGWRRDDAAPGEAPPP